ncbi:MAG TPA: DUF3142 domain-containing protein [Novosphingobium sp.]|nr:DUF3142 domain-containing protein [Novosphingobium sp.]
MSRRAALAAGGAALVLAACGDRGAAPVDPRGHDAFFLWPGVTPPAWLARAREVYVLTGEVRHRPGSPFVPLRATPRVTGPVLWLVVRVERLDWEEAIYREVLRGLALWERAGNRVAGLQVDFDAATRGLDRYAAFLADLRRRLPGRWKLSITGLMDWSAGGDPRALAGLAGSVDEIVVQTYQGRRTIPGYEAYLASLRRLGMAYKVGLVEGGDWREPAGLAGDPRFRGYVVFLLGGKASPPA